MKALKLKKISMMMGIIMIFTMVFSSSSVFADYEAQNARAKFLRLDSSSYLRFPTGETANVPIVAIFENDKVQLSAQDCTYVVNNPDVVKVENGTFIALNPGVATVTVYAYGAQRQIMVEIWTHW